MQFDEFPVKPWNVQLLYRINHCRRFLGHSIHMCYSWLLVGVTFQVIFIHSKWTRSFQRANFFFVPCRIVATLIAFNYEITSIIPYCGLNEINAWWILKLIICQCMIFWFIRWKTIKTSYLIIFGTKIKNWGKRFLNMFICRFFLEDKSVQ